MADEKETRAHALVRAKRAIRAGEDSEAVLERFVAGEYDEEPRPPQPPMLSLWPFDAPVLRELPKADGGTQWEANAVSIGRSASFMLILNPVPTAIEAVEIWNSFVLTVRQGPPTPYQDAAPAAGESREP